MILVIGGTGLLGSNLLVELVRVSGPLIATYQTESKIQLVKKLFRIYFKENADEYFNKIRWVKLDVLDLVSLEEVMKDCSHVYHCAALVSFRRRDFSQMMKINAGGTANVVNMCLKLKIEKLAYVSSTSAVGKVLENEVYQVRETNKWSQNDKTSGYAISKYTAEKEVWRAVEEGLNVVIINPSVIFGPGSWNESSLTIFRTIYNGLLFYTKGSNAFVDVRDVVKSLLLLMNSDVSGERFLCTGTNISFKELFKIIAGKLNKKPPSWYANRLMCEVAWRLASLLALFKGKATLTKESVESSQALVRYDSSKLKKQLNIDFLPLDETVQFAIEGRLD